MALFSWIRRIRNRSLRRKAMPRLHPDALELGAILEGTWPVMSDELQITGAPLNEGDGDGGDGDGSGDGDGDEGKGGDGSDDGDGDEGKGADDGDGDEGDGDGSGDGDGDGDEGKTAEEYRKELRRYERGSKRRDDKHKKTIEGLETKLKAREDADKSEQEKAIEKAREEAKDEVLSGVEKERRSDRLEMRVTKLARKGVTVGEGDDAEEFKFADEDDAMVYLERKIAKGDLDIEDLFDDGKVKEDAVKAELAELLEEKAHLRAVEGEGKSATAAAGSGDGGKGKGGSKSIGEMTPDDHYKAVRKGDK